MAWWPWWLSALALAGTALAFVFVTRRPLGVSGSYGALLGGAADAADAASCVAAVARPGEGRAPHAWFVGGIVGGGVIFAALNHPSNQPLAELLPTGLFAQAFGALTVPALFVGGVLVGVGTAAAGGCTSGHGLVGCGRLQPASLVATACFFGTAIVTTFVIRALLLGGSP